MGLLDKLFRSKPSREEFAKIVLTALKRSGLHDLHFDASNNSIRVDSADKTCFLDNAYSSYCSADTNLREATLQRYVSSFVDMDETPESYEKARPGLMPVVRDPAYFGLTDLMLRSQGRDTAKLVCPTESIAEGLCVGVAYDTPHTIANANLAYFTKWKVGFSEALKLAVENLRERSSPSGLKEITSGLFMSEWDDSYDSARILLPDLLHRLRLDGDPVVFLPARNRLWVTGRYNVSTLEAVLTHGGEDHFNLGHSLSPNLYTHEGGSWRLFVPEDDSLHKQWLTLKSRRDAMDYEQQKGYLDQLYKLQNLDVFVAKCVLYQRKDKSMFTQCVWSSGIDSLLPKADAIVFNLGRGQTFVVRWDKAAPVISCLLEGDTGLAPLRFRARNFPSNEQLAELRLLAEN